MNNMKFRRNDSNFQVFLLPRRTAGDGHSGRGQAIPATGFDDHAWNRAGNQNLMSVVRCIRAAAPPPT